MSGAGEASVPLQPLLHDAHVVLRAPTQAWSDARGDMGAQPVHGLYHSNTRMLDRLELRVEGHRLEPLRVTETDASTASFTTLLRGLPGERADPRLRVERTRTVEAGRLSETIAFESALPAPVSLVAVVTMHADFAPIHRVKEGRLAAGTGHDDGPPAALRDGAEGEVVAEWVEGPVGLRVAAPGALLSETDAGLELRWPFEVPPGQTVRLGWSADATDAGAVVSAAPGRPGWASLAPATASATATDPRLRRWVERALADLDGLRLTLVGDDDQFFAAGAPWFFTLFGRDAIWAARFLLPLDPGFALSTARALAKLQGTRVDPADAEQPGKIMHELRPAALELPQHGIVLPPLYYGTVDATPLWVLLLRDAWRAGAPAEEVRRLLPQLRGALAWMRDYAAGEDGFLRYIDETGHGLSNQGWKDSDDSIQWHDGRLAEGPIALVEVQGYAYAAALAGAELLEAFAEPGATGTASTAETAEAAQWRAWAAALRAAFHTAFWVASPDGDYPAIALDAYGERVDSLASNMGHLLGTGIVDHRQAALIARRLVSPELDSGFGLRTMSTADAGYWPLSYHGGSVWAHDTAVAVVGLAQEGFHDEARRLAEGLIAAAEGFGFRMPELHSGDRRLGSEAAAPYPAACRPQAWSAAAAVAIASALG